jgi:ADP-heptose:LPS heptosyltransferase
MPPLKIKNVKKIAVFRALKLGDLLCSVPAFIALRKAYPTSCITLIGLPWAKEFSKRYQEVFDDFLEFKGFPGLPEIKFNPKNSIDFISQLNQKKFDLLIQMQGNGNIVNSLLMLANPKYFAGFYKKTNFKPNNRYFTSFPSNLNEIHTYLKLIKHLGIPSQGDQIEFPLIPKDYLDYEKLNLKFKNLPYVVIHPGASTSSKRWGPESFASLANLVYNSGYKVVLTGLSNEKDLTNKVISLLEFNAINLTGKTSLGALALLLKNSRLLISNDTGISHLAAATKTPSVIFALKKNIKRWSPLDTVLHKVIDMKSPNALKEGRQALNYYLSLDSQPFTADITKLFQPQGRPNEFK